MTHGNFPLPIDSSRDAHGERTRWSDAILHPIAYLRSTIGSITAGGSKQTDVSSPFPKQSTRLGVEQLEERDM